MAERTYLTLTPIDGPCLELGVTLQPFVLGDDVRARGTVKAPASLPRTPGTLYLDAETTAFFSVSGDLDEPPAGRREGVLDLEIYGRHTLRRIAKAETVAIFAFSSESPESLARCLAGDDTTAVENIVAKMKTLNPIVLTRSALEQAIVRGVREVSRLNAALLAPQDPDAPHDPFRPALTVPAEETWTLRRLFGHIDVWTTRMAEAA